MLRTFLCLFAFCWNIAGYSQVPFDLHDEFKIEANDWFGLEKLTLKTEEEQLGYFEQAGSLDPYYQFSIALYDLEDRLIATALLHFESKRRLSIDIVDSSKQPIGTFFLVGSFLPEFEKNYWRTAEIISPDGKLLATGSNNAFNTCFIFQDPSTQQTLFTLNRKHFFSRSKRITIENHKLDPLLVVFWGNLDDFNY